MSVDSAITNNAEFVIRLRTCPECSSPLSWLSLSTTTEMLVCANSEGCKYPFEVPMDAKEFEKTYFREKSSGPVGDVENVDRT